MNDPKVTCQLEGQNYNKCTVSNPSAPRRLKFTGFSLISLISETIAFFSKFLLIGHNDRDFYIKFCRSSKLSVQLYVDHHGESTRKVLHFKKSCGRSSKLRVSLEVYRMNP